MTTKHTPGPWKLESESRGPDGSDLVITDARGGYTIAVCAVGSTGINDVDEAEANARLLRSAPDLLKTLKAIVSTHNRTAAEIEPGFTCGCASVCVPALDAIAKAEG